MREAEFSAFNGDDALKGLLMNLVYALAGKNSMRIDGGTRGIRQSALNDVVLVV
jgi:hypothetical protein